MTKKYTNITEMDALDLLIGNVQDFANAAILTEEVITSYDLRENSRDVVEGTDGRTHHEMWGSLKTVSHYNLGIALELLIKLLLFLNGKAIPQGHVLTTLHDDLYLPVQQQLEATFQDIKQGLSGGGYELIVFITVPPSEPPPEYPPSLNRDLSSLRKYFEYFDQDVRLSVKRYSYEFVEEHQCRHYLSDLTLFIQLIKHVIGNIELYIAPEASAEQEGTGMGEQGTRASTGEGKEQGQVRGA